MSANEVGKGRINFPKGQSGVRIGLLLPSVGLQADSEIL